MNNENLFEILLCSKINKINPILYIYSKNHLCTEYLWRLLHIRNVVRYISKRFYNSYVLCHSINKFFVKQDPKVQYNSNILIWSIFRNNNIMNTQCAIIGLLINLQKLEFSMDYLICLPSEIGLLIKLNNLNISYNKLQCLPTEIGLLIKLNYLDISYNNLQYLPTEIGLLTQISELSICYNRLKYLPSEMNNLLLLKSMNVDDGVNNIEKMNNLKNLLYDGDICVTFPI